MPDHSEVFEKVASIVCGKPAGISHTECLKSVGSHNPLCRDYGKCRLYEKTCEQFEYVLHPRTENSFLRACPGGGKTEVIGMKAAYEIRRWDVLHAGIAVLTFTNNAADVILERVTQFAGNVGHPHFIGTFDSWLHGYLANPFAYILTGYLGKKGDRSIRIVAASDRDEWLNAYKCKTPFVKRRKPKRGKNSKVNSNGESPLSIPIFANHFWYDHETDRFLIRKPFVDSSDSIDHETYFATKEFQEYLADNDKKWLTIDVLKKDLGDRKKLFWKDGFVNYQDVECLSVLLLKKETLRSRLSRRFPLVIVDECQDLSWGQLRILELLKEQGSRVHLVGDLNQAIYAFKKVDPLNVERFVAEPGVHKLALQRNFRSVQPIVNLCGKLLYQGDVTGEPWVGDAPACVYFIYDPSDMSELPRRFETYLRTRSIDVTKSAILARGHATVNKLRPAASRVAPNDSITLATAVDLWSSAEIQAIDESMKCIGKFIATKFFPKQSIDSRHHYRPEMVGSALQWRLSLVRVLDECLHNGIFQTSVRLGAIGRKSLGRA